MASLMLLLSPSISYYARYIRHDTFNMLMSVLLLWTVLQLPGKAGRPLALQIGRVLLLAVHDQGNQLYLHGDFRYITFSPLCSTSVCLRWIRPHLYRVFLGVLILALLLGAAFGASLVGAEMEEQALDEAGNTRAATLTFLSGESS
jgi:predicted membrane-bound mannosyltransferase